jgi:hypothetical protein
MHRAGWARLLLLAAVDCDCRRLLLLPGRQGRQLEAGRQLHSTSRSTHEDRTCWDRGAWGNQDLHAVERYQLVTGRYACRRREAWCCCRRRRRLQHLLLVRLLLLLHRHLLADGRRLLLLQERGQPTLRQGRQHLHQLGVVAAAGRPTGSC